MQRLLELAVRSLFGGAALVVVMVVLAAVSACGGNDSSKSAAPSHVVGIGDSYMTAQNSKGQSFMDVLAASIDKTSGHAVDLNILADNQNTTARVLESLRTDESFGAAIAKADMIVLSVGGNDADPFGIYPKGTCAPSQPLPDCLSAYAPKFASNYEAILSKIAALRDGKPTAIRVLSADNPFVGLSEAPRKTFGVDFFAQVAAAETESMCAVAKKHDAQCVDFLHIFSGKDGTSDPEKYLAYDHGHPGDLGIKIIAAELIRPGFPELG